ncbi:hypothetical protein KJ068_10465 [bacterium]|nr:hypothetical protein [bacterium]
MLRDSFAMPFVQNSANRRIDLCLGLVFLWSTLSFSQNAGPLAGITSASDYLVYYGGWNATKVLQAQYFDLVILDIRSGITPAQVADMRNGLDDLAGTGDDVIVVSYLSIGEDDDGQRAGDGRGPVYWNAQSSSPVYQNRGVASWYVDDADKNGSPDQNGVWGSFYVNAGDSLWQKFVRTKAHGADDIINQWKCDGLFLDTIDTASPWAEYHWTAAGMSQCIARLRDWYPQAVIIGNRGLFYFDPAQTASYAHNIRSYVNAIMFESYYTEWNWSSGMGVVSPYFADNKDYWAQRVNTEAQKSDGFTVLCLDYLNPAQVDYQLMLENQVHEAIEVQGWTDAVSSIMLDEIRYDIYHQHTPDVNPPTWSKTVGVRQARVESGKVVVRWNRADDRHQPVKYNLYYSTASPIDFANAPRLLHIEAEAAAGYDLQFAVPGLIDSAMYFFAIRAVDSIGNEEANRVEIGVVFGGTTGVEAAKNPESFRLHQNFPNPFNAGTRIELEVPPSFAEEIVLEIFDVAGGLVQEMRHPAASSMRISFQWNGETLAGKRAGSGIYFYRAAAWPATRKMVVVQ